MKDGPILICAAKKYGVYVCRKTLWRFSAARRTSMDVNGSFL
jgi:hypothetical protein